jgi:hypothetical protein
MVHRVPTQPALPSFRYSTKPDTLPRCLSECLDSGNLASDRREDVDYASDYDHFGCVRVLVWAFFFQGALVMAISAWCWVPRVIQVMRGNAALQRERGAGAHATGQIADTRRPAEAKLPATNTLTQGRDHW